MLPARFLAACLTLGLALPALAEQADRTKPINLEADTVTYDEARRHSVYDGNVVLSQGTLGMRADRLDVYQNDDGLDRLTAVGRPVAFRQKTDTGDLIEGFADRIEYNGRTSRVDLIGSARLRRGDDDLRGERITYNAGNSTYEVVGASQTSGQGRVRAVIRPRGATQP